MSRALDQIQERYDEDVVSLTRRSFTQAALVGTGLVIIGGDAAAQTSFTTTLTTSATVPSGTSLEITAYEDTDGDGSAENTQTITVGDGTNTYDLSNLEFTSDTETWFEGQSSVTDSAADDAYPTLSQLTQLVEGGDVSELYVQVTGDVPSGTSIEVSVNTGTASSNPVETFTKTSSGTTSHQITNADISSGNDIWLDVATSVTDSAASDVYPTVSGLVLLGVINNTSDPKLTINNFSAPDSDVNTSSYSVDVQVEEVNGAQTNNLQVQLEITDPDGNVAFSSTQNPTELSGSQTTVTFSPSIDAGEYTAEATANADNASQTTQSDSFVISEPGLEIQNFDIPAGTTDDTYDNIEVTVEETNGVQTQNLELRLTISDSDGNSVFDQTVSKSDIQNSTATATFTPGSFSGGQYTAEARAISDNRSTVTTTDGFTIADADIQVAEVNVNDELEAGNTTAVNVTVEETAGANTSNLEVGLVVEDQNGNEVFNKGQPVDDIANNSTTATFYPDLPDDQSNYTVSALAEADNTERVIQNTSTTALTYDSYAPEDPEGVEGSIEGVTGMFDNTFTLAQKTLQFFGLTAAIAGLVTWNTSRNENVATMGKRLFLLGLASVIVFLAFSELMSLLKWIATGPA